MRQGNADLHLLVITERRVLLYARPWYRYARFFLARETPVEGAITAFNHGAEPSITCWGQQFFFTDLLYDFVLELVEKVQGDKPPPQG
jgi:hypothetical protein